MPIPIDNLDDPRLEVYRQVKDRDLAGRGERFIAESSLVVRRLLDSRFPVESVVVNPKRAGEMAEAMANRAPLYVVSNDLMRQLIGFRLQSGVLACGRRMASPTIDQFMISYSGAGSPRPKDSPYLGEIDEITKLHPLPRYAGGGLGRGSCPIEENPSPQPSPASTRERGQDAQSYASPGLTLMILPEPSSTENLGAMIRIAGAFGCLAVILGERSCDPFYRQSIRISMGAVFSMPIIRSINLLDDLRILKTKWNFRLAGTVLRDNAIPLRDYRRPLRLGILFGNEAQGLSDEQTSACDDLLTIPMSPGADSLNVAVAAGIVTHALTHGF